MAVRLSTGFRNDILGSNSFQTIYNNSIIYLYSGTQPASADDASSGTLLGKITVDGTGSANLTFDTPADGEIAKPAADAWELHGETSGTIGWGRLLSSGAEAGEGASSSTDARIDFSVGQSGADMNLTNTSVTASSQATIDSFKYKIPSQ